MNWYENKIINKTGLACILWNDADSDTLRKRLDYKIKRKSFTDKELADIQMIIHRFSKEFAEFYFNSLK